MANCPACDNPIGMFKSVRVKDGVVCKECYAKAGLKDFLPQSVEVWEVVILCEMNAEKKQEYLEEKRQKAKESWEAFKQQREQEKADTTPRCPKCGSTSITASQTGFNVGKALIGGAIAGELGAFVAGTSGSKKVRVTCLNCGHQWIVGKK